MATRRQSLGIYGCSDRSSCETKIFSEAWFQAKTLGPLIGTNPRPFLQQIVPNIATIRGCDVLNVAQSLRDWDFERNSFSDDFRVFDESRPLGISVAERLSYKNSQPLHVGGRSSEPDSFTTRDEIEDLEERS
jgi:hypothetical protein